MKSHVKPWSVGIIAGLAVLVLWLGALVLVPRIYGKPESPGVFGDMFGALNALFTGLALVGVTVTVWMQRVQFLYQLDAHEESERRNTEQLAMTKEQLEIARQEIAMERERIAREAEPLLIFTAGNSQPHLFIMKFVNRGGAVKQPRFSSGWAKIYLTPDDAYIGRDQIGHLSFENPARPAMFDFEYVRVRDGVIGKERYVFYPDEMKIARNPTVAVP